MNGHELDIIIISEVEQSGKDKYHMISLINGTTTKMTIQMILFSKQKETYKEKKNMITKAERGMGG